ncbi:hypothetical protein J6590_006457 [Homalodisca vitripennis]|nr:hypothetical protein J6590_006457 [Homalodisca vitripennis]
MWDLIPWRGGGVTSRCLPIMWDLIPWRGRGVTSLLLPADGVYRLCGILSRGEVEGSPVYCCLLMLPTVINNSHDRTHYNDGVYRLCGILSRGEVEGSPVYCCLLMLPTVINNSHDRTHYNDVSNQCAEQ